MKIELTLVIVPQNAHSVIVLFSLLYDSFINITLRLAQKYEVQQKSKRYLPNKDKQIELYSSCIWKQLILQFIRLIIGFLSLKDLILLITLPP